MTTNDPHGTHQLSVTLYWVGVDVEFLSGCYLYGAHLSRDFYHIELAERSLEYLKAQFPQASVRQRTLLYNKLRKADRESYRVHMACMEQDVRLTLEGRRR